MATSPWTTYDDTNILESVVDQVFMVDLEEKPFISSIGSSTAGNTLHEWAYDALTTYQDNKNIEGTDYGFGNITGPLRASNRTQILLKTFQVSRTERVVAGAGVTDQFVHQRMKAVREIGTDLERAAICSTIITGTGSSARSMAGMLNYISTNTSAAAANITLTLNQFRKQLILCAEQGKRANFAIMNSNLRANVDDFTASNSSLRRVEDARTAVLPTTVNVINTWAGEVKVMWSVNIPDNGTTADLVVGNTDLFRLAVLDAFHEDNEIGQTGDSTKGAIRGEYTLEVHNEEGNAELTGLTVS